MNAYRTDLALEAAQALKTSPDTALPGVITQEETVEGYPLTRVEITTEEGAELVGKPIGQYLTLGLAPLFRREPEAFPRGAQAIASLISSLLPQEAREGLVLVVGLGNRMVTPDAVGPRTADYTMVTRHLVAQEPEKFSLFHPVSALAAGVLGTTGVESSELVSAVVKEIRPACIIAVDALAARSVERLCSTIQITDTGITPGSGIGNSRKALNRETLGIPVIAVGVPTVVDAGTLVADLTGAELSSDQLQSYLVTPKDIDSQIADLSKVIGYGIDLALQEGLTVSDVELFLS
ncbi:MAG: GPR endopeptidase [Oscillospiraceae bacterium]|nr:GPR endopeptidase [Oscillospiraceae bacterium]